MTAPPTKVRILLVEDNVLTRLGTAAVIRTQVDLEIVGETGDGGQAVELARTLSPDVVVLDMKLPGLDGVQVATALARLAPPPAILVLSQYEGDASIFNALRAGAHGYVTKDVDVAELLTAIRAVAAGQRYLPVKVAGRLAERMQQPELTARDLRVLEKLYEGMTNRMIAEALHITERSAAVYVSQVMGKLGARTRQEAAALAVQRGIIQPG